MIRDVPNDVIKLMMFSYSPEGSARVWYDKEPPNSILTWEDLVNKFVNQFFPPSKTTHLKNEISRFTQRFEETFGEAWERFKEMLRACPHNRFTELAQIDTFYNGLNDNDQDSLNAELAEYINTLGWNRPDFYNSDDDDDEDCTIAITSDFLITDSLSMGDEHLDTILEKELDEFNKSSVEDLVPNPSESEGECECDVPDRDDSQTTNFLMFSNPLFDDSTSSDDESSHEEVIHEMSFKTYSNPLFDLDEEIISSDFNPIHNEDLDSTPKNDRFDTKSYLFESLINHDESIPLGIDCDNSDSEGDTLSLEGLLHDDPIPLPDTLDFDFSNVVRVFLPFFTYPVTSSILLSSGSEDTIFDPGISNYHFSSLEMGVSHRSRTFTKFNVYPNHMNESPMMIHGKNIPILDVPLFHFYPLDQLKYGGN
nr:reverse transcriptase domain-containing protein [Tanacetum cinerariifolium]